MLKTITLALIAMFSLSDMSRAQEEDNQSVKSVGQLCSDYSSDDSVFTNLRGTELVLSGSLSSIGNKRMAFLGNRVDFLAGLVISPAPQKDQFGQVASQNGCTVTCLLSVPGQQCAHDENGELECKDITNPQLEENERLLLKLNGGELLTLKGVLSGKSQLPQYSTLGGQANIVNFVLSGCQIIQIGTDDNDDE